MRQMIRRMFPGASGAPGGQRTGCSRRYRPGLEGLEARIALSLGNEFTINPKAAEIDGVGSASSSGGLQVAVWGEELPNGVSYIRAQVYARVGNLDIWFVAGPEITVDTVSATKNGYFLDHHPSVAMDSKGDFVVTWVEGIPEQPGMTDPNRIMARSYTSNGAAVGSSFVVSAPPVGANLSHVAMDAAGDFVISYLVGDFENGDIQARLYKVGASPMTIDVASTGAAEAYSSASMTIDGRFDIAYQYLYNPKTGDNDIYLSRYSSSGVLLANVPVAQSGSDEEQPSVSMDDSGNAVVAYEKNIGGLATDSQNYNIVARRVTSAGTLSQEFTIAATSNQELTPSVALSHAGGAFVVSYVSTPKLNDVDPMTVTVAEINGLNSVIGSFGCGSPRVGPSISIDGSNTYLVVYQDGNESGVASDGTHALGRLGSLPQLTFHRTAQVSGDGIEADGAAASGLFGVVPESVISPESHKPKMSVSAGQSTLLGI
jgi:hypothetical protein